MTESRKISVRTFTPWLLGACLWTGGASGCLDRGAPQSDHHETSRSPVVYGSDDRKDAFEYPDQVWAEEVAGFTAALMTPSVISVSPAGTISFLAPTLETQGVCADERFANQISAAFCSGTLIAPDLVLTAGHCVPSASACTNSRLVFNYYMEGPGAMREVTLDDVFSCAELLVQEQNPFGLDYAIVRLDRPTNRSPARLAPSSAALEVGTQLLVHGFPSGLPIKLDDGGRVRDGRAAERDYFVANLDTFGGNSGSGVFDASIGELVGIMARGDIDYVFDDTDGCYRVNQCLDDSCIGERSTYAFRAVDALCSSGAVTPLCPCGDGTCDAAGGETTATCPLDCGTRCSDDVCNGSESPVNCPVDCGTCGNAVCDDGEDENACCTDCGCSAPMICASNACVPDPADGDTCADVAELRPTGTYVIPGNTTTASNDYQGGCIFNTNAPDRVYSFTLSEETWIDTRVTGFDSALYVRTDCANEESEIACNDDARPPGEGGSRIAQVYAPGTYYLFVDARGTQAGPYDLTVSFVPIRPAENDSCVAPVSITATGTQVAQGLLGPITARNDYLGTCGGGGTDHVYTFTTSVPMDVTATVEGYDSVLYIRSVCESSNPTHELACNDDHEGVALGGSSITLSEVAPGTYYLIVDSFSGGNNVSEYTLTVAFEGCADIDADGICDEFDGCPSDPAKPGPGQCGCGAADTDSDSDGTADCLDGCPNDGSKLEPGQCGCGMPDIDADGEGIMDCNDGCPNDVSKISPGECGCGIADTDSDGDGTADCLDGCINDAGKVGAGKCGCGVADRDSDGDGAFDCVDACPGDPAKSVPGTCGCGSTESSCEPKIAGGGGCSVGGSSHGAVPSALLALVAMLYVIRNRPYRAASQR